ncbi:hypothetical protein SXM_0531 [Shewanella xiamenensis]|nr:hypothetical protein SXM_0531 [Shewanella xiamenensis]
MGNIFLWNFGIQTFIGNEYTEQKRANSLYQPPLIEYGG